MFRYKICSAKQFCPTIAGAYTLNKQNAHPENLDWIIAGLRWLVVLRVVIVFITNRNRGASDGSLIPILIGLVVYNAILAVILLVGLKSRPVQAIIVVADALVAGLLYWGTGGQNLILLGAGLLP